MNKRIFLDTSFIIAILSTSDVFHTQAVIQAREISSSDEIWITDAILFEVGNAFSKIDKTLASGFIRNCTETLTTRIVWTDEVQFKKALEKYTQSRDKNWSLTDCLSFLVMAEQELEIAYSSDHHFEQAGFQYTLKRGMPPH